MWAMFSVLFTLLAFAVEAPVVALVLLALVCALPIGDWVRGSMGTIAMKVARFVPGGSYFISPPVEPPHVVLARLEQEVRAITGMVEALQAQVTALGCENRSGGGAALAGASNSAPAVSRGAARPRSKAVARPPTDVKRAAGGAPPGGER